MDSTPHSEPTPIEPAQAEATHGGMLNAGSTVAQALFRAATRDTMRRYINALESCEEGGTCP